MRKIHRTIAKETRRSNAKEEFEHLKNYHLAVGGWSWNWDEAWRSWCHKSLEIDGRAW